MSTFTCRNGHVVSIKEKFCPICGLPIRYMDGKEEPVTYEEYMTYEEYVRSLKRKRKKLIRNMESRLKLGERYAKTRSPTRL